MDTDHGWRVTTPLSSSHQPTAGQLAVDRSEPSHVVTVRFFGADLSVAEVCIEGGQNAAVGDSPLVLRAAAAELRATAEGLELNRSG